MPSSKLSHTQKLDILEKFKRGWKIFAIRNDFEKQGLRVSYASVRYIIEKYRTGEFHHAECVVEKEHKFHKITKNHIVLIQELLRKDCVQSSADIQRQLPNQELCPSRRTVLRAIRHAGWTSAQPRYCAMVSKRNQEKRTEFCETLIAQKEDFNNAIFSDECTIQLHDNKTTCFRELNGAAPIISRPKHPLKVHMWAAISRLGTCPLLIFDGIMEKEFFTNSILNNVLLPFIRQSFTTTHRFVQDNDPKHTSKYAQQFMEENGIHWWKWPAESPDLNPIEMVWNQLKRYVSAKNPQTKEQLLDYITEFWTEEMDSDICNRYIDHLYKVVPVVKELKGRASGDLPKFLFREESSKGKSIEHFENLLSTPAKKEIFAKKSKLYDGLV